MTIRAQEGVNVRYCISEAQANSIAKQWWAAGIVCHVKFENGRWSVIKGQNQDA